MTLFVREIPFGAPFGRCVLLHPLPPLLNPFFAGGPGDNDCRMRALFSVTTSVVQMGKARERAYPNVIPLVRPNTPMNTNVVNFSNYNTAGGLWVGGCWILIQENQPLTPYLAGVQHQILLTHSLNPPTTNLSSSHKGLLLSSIIRLILGQTL